MAAAALSLELTAGLARLLRPGVKVSRPGGSTRVSRLDLWRYGPLSQKRSFYFPSKAYVGQGEAYRSREVQGIWISDVVRNSWPYFSVSKLPDKCPGCGSVH